MSREWAILWEHGDDLAAGLGNTVLLSAAAAVGALLLGALVSTVLTVRSAVLARTAQAIVDLMRCVPFLLFAYVIYYGLPSWGLRFGNWSAGMIALLLYNAAYMAEAFRAGWQTLPRDCIEAGHAFGFRGLRLFRRVILPPVLLTTAPIVGNQVIQIVKDSSFLAVIAVPELTHTANAIQSNYYIPFSTFILTVLLYWLVCGTIELGVAAFRGLADARR